MAKNIQIIQGQDLAFTISLTRKSDKKPFNLTGMTGATAYFPAATGGAITTIGTLASADLGKIQFTLSETQTDALAAGDEQNAEFRIDQGSTRSIAQILGRVAIIAELF